MTVYCSNDDHDDHDIETHKNPKLFSLSLSLENV
jgi:hypothetical protein